MVTTYFAEVAAEDPMSTEFIKHRNELKALFEIDVNLVSGVLVNRDTALVNFEVAILEDNRALFIEFSKDGAPLTIIADDPVQLFREVEEARHDERNVTIEDEALAQIFIPLFQNFYEL